ncbi:MAG: hypothetical protein AAGF23_21675, partial [Acidobacteriota bacterium]
MRKNFQDLLTALTLVSQLGCWAPPSSEPSSVAYAGCVRAQPGPVCFLEEGATLRLWVAADAGSRVDVAGPVTVIESREVQSGRLFVLETRRPEGSVTLIEDGRRHVPLSFRPPPDPEPNIALAERRLAAGEAEAALAGLEAAWDSIRLQELGAAWRVRGRLQRATGAMELGAESMRSAVVELDRAGWLHQTAGATAELAYGLIYQADRFADVRALLEARRPHAEAPAEARYGWSYLRGLLALNTGDVRGALHDLGTSADIAERLGLEAWRMSAEQPLAHQLQRVGRGAEAAAIFARHRRELPADLGPCDRASLLNNLAWNQLLIREIDGELGGVDEDPTPWLLDAKEAFRDRPCVETDERANVEMNLALAALHRGDAEQARLHLEAASALEARPDLRARFWRLEIEARLAMVSGQPAAALERYRQLEILATDALATTTLWHAEAGQARAYEALGDSLAALAAYEKAERHLVEASLAVPIDSGRETFVDQGLQVTRRHIDLLIELGRTDDAYLLARKARSRVVRSLHRQSRLSRLTADEQRQWDEAISAYRAERRAFDALAVEDWTLSVEQL